MLYDKFTFQQLTFLAPKAVLIEDDDNQQT